MLPTKSVNLNWFSLLQTQNKYLNPIYIRNRFTMSVHKHKALNTTKILLYSIRSFCWVEQCSSLKMALCSSLWIFRENPSLICQVLNLCLLERDNINSYKFVEVIPLAEGLLLEKLCTYRIRDDSFSDSCLFVIFMSQSCGYQVPFLREPGPLQTSILVLEKACWLILFFGWMNIIWCLSCSKYQT